jgi:phage-related baseplate assembly protein
MLEYLGAFNNTPRLPPYSSVTTFRFVLSTPLVEARTVPAGTRISPTSSDIEIFFATDVPFTFAPGVVTADIPAHALTPGTIGNGFIPAQLTQLVDPLPYVSAVVNLTESMGGIDKESDDSYRERIRLSNASYSTAGPEDAYIYWAKTASPAIVDVAAVSPTPTNVTIVPLLSGGVIPSQSVLDAVAEALNDRTRRPIGDRVTVSAPTVVVYTINMTYYIHPDRATEVDIIKAKVAEAVAKYKIWQKSKLGRSINPSELSYLVMQAGAYRVNIVSPVYADVTKLKVASDTATTVTYGGLVDD